MELIEKVLLLRDVDLLRDADAASLALLASIAEVVELDADAVRLRRSSSDPSLFVVASGEVVLAGGDGRERRFGEGVSFGARALLAGEPERLEVRADEPTRLLRVAGSDFRALLLESPEIAVDLGRSLARRLAGVLA